MATTNETTVPKFGSFKPKKSIARSGNSPVGDARDNGRQREVRLGTHRVEKPLAHRPSRGDHYRPDTTHHTQHQRPAREERHRDDRRRDERYRDGRHYERRPRDERYHDQRHRDGPARRDNQFRDRSMSTQEHDCCFVDTKGDPANQQYRRSNKWNVPLYHLYGRGSIVGLDPDIKIDRKFSDQHSYTLMYPRNKAPVKVIEPFEIDGLLEPTAANHDNDDSGETENDEAQDLEAAFMPLFSEQKQDEG